jgi:rare lipoprotein A (peptidoglycan hydrolase)
MNLRDALLLTALIAVALAGSARTTESAASSTQVVVGEASWYENGPGLYGAVHSYRFGDPTYPLKVCRADDSEVCVTVTVRDHMANRVRLVDLSRDAFSRLAPLSAGVVQVTVERGEPRVTLPPTDTP